jgi:glycosyltransferase involved in cell wall biosynthesis
MKVLHIIPSIAAVRGGPSQAIMAMVKALREQGIKAEIATTNDNGLAVLDVPLHQLSDYQGVPVWFFPRFSPPIPAVREFAFSAAFTQWLWRSAANYDLLHIHAIFSYPSTVAMAIARQQQVPYIVRPLGQLCAWSLQQRSLKKQLYLRLIERQNLNHSQALHLTSPQEEQEVAQLKLKPPCFVLPHGLTLPVTQPNARDRLRQYLQVPGDEFIILFLSRLHPKKGLAYLLPALSQLTHRRFTFVLAGSGSPEYEAEVNKLLATCNLSERTHVAGLIAGALKDLLLQGSDLFTLTSHSENFGIAVLEAMAAGLPVVVTPGVALASVVADYQLGDVAALDSATIAATIEDYLDQPHLAKERGDRARQLVATHYTWKQIAVQLSQIYGSLLHPSSLPQPLHTVDYVP